MSSAWEDVSPMWKNESFPYSMSMRKAGTKDITVVQELQSEEAESDDELFVVEQVGTVNHNRKGQFFVPLSFEHELGSTILGCTGATCNVMRLEDVCAILHTNNPPLQPETSQLKCYDISVINTLGQCTLECRYQKNTYHLSFKVIYGDKKPLLSGTTCME